MTGVAGSSSHPTMFTRSIAVAFAGVADLWGGYFTPSATDIARVKAYGFDRVSMPYGPQTSLTEFVAQAQIIKAAGLSLHIVLHHDGQGCDYLPYAAPHGNPALLISLNTQFAQALATVLTAGDSVEVDNEPVPFAGATWTDTQPLYAAGGTYAQCIAAWRAACPVVAVGIPITGDQSGVEAQFDLTGPEVPLTAWGMADFLCAHAYIRNVNLATYPQPGDKEAIFAQFVAFDNLAVKVGKPWFVSEFGCSPTTEPYAPLVYRDAAALVDWFASSMNIGRCAWQWGGPAGYALKGTAALNGALKIPVLAVGTVVNA